MAEFLIRRKENTDPNDSGKDAMLYKSGDFVLWKPDGHEWGLLENPATHPDGPAGCGFYIIKLAGVTPTPEQEARWLTGDADENEQMTRRRTWVFDISALNTSRRNTLLTTGILEAQWGHVRSAIKHKDTGETE